MNGPVNPGELALAAIGVSPLIDGEVPRFGIERQREALSIPNKLVRLAADVVDNDVKRPPMPRPHSYRRLLDHFAAGLQADQLQELTERFPHDASEMAGAFLMTAQAALQHLKKMFPMSVYSTFTGPKNLTPDDEAVWRFFSQLEVLNDPLRVFPLIATGAILRSQVAAVREIYPTLSEAIDGAIYDAIAKKSAAKSNYRLPPRAELGVSTWLGRRLVPFKKPSPAPAPAPISGQPSANAAATDLATRNQKAIAGT